MERDLGALLELGFPVERLARGLYRIADRPPSLHPIEALALFAAGRLLYHQAPTRQYRMALDKLARMLPEPLRGLLLRSTQGLEARQGESRTLEMVARALLERRVLAFEYRSGGSKNWRPKELLVYFLEANRANLGLYAIGYERTYHRAVLTFKLSRMRHARLLDESYEIPQDFDPNAYLRRAWGVVGVREKGWRCASVSLRRRPGGFWRGTTPASTSRRSFPTGAFSPASGRPLQGRGALGGPGLGAELRPPGGGAEPPGAQAALAGGGGAGSGPLREPTGGVGFPS